MLELLLVLALYLFEAFPHCSNLSFRIPTVLLKLQALLMGGDNTTAVGGKGGRWEQTTSGSGSGSRSGSGSGSGRREESRRVALRSTLCWYHSWPHEVLADCWFPNGFPSGSNRRRTGWEGEPLSGWESEPLRRGLLLFLGRLFERAAGLSLVRTVPKEMRMRTALCVGISF
jgi:hypothetical protein